MNTNPKPLTLNPNYLAMVRGTRELHQLLAAGRDDSPEAAAIRDATDGPWQALSEAERNRVRSLSEDLYSLVEPPPPVQQMTAQVQAKLLEWLEIQASPNHRRPRLTCGSQVEASRHVLLELIQHLPPPAALRQWRTSHRGFVASR